MNKLRILSLFILSLSIISFGAFFVSNYTKEILIVFDSNGGSIVSNQKVKYQSQVVKPENPTRENYTFLGWYNDGVLYDFNRKVEENTLLVALWEENTNYLVTITLEGITYESRFYNGETIKIEKYLLPTKDGYHINLYNNDILFDLLTPITSNLNLIAKYEKNS